MNWLKNILKGKGCFLFFSFLLFLQNTMGQLSTAKLLETERNYFLSEGKKKQEFALKLVQHYLKKSDFAQAKRKLFFMEKNLDSIDLEMRILACQIQIKEKEFLEVMPFSKNCAMYYPQQASRFLFYNFLGLFFSNKIIDAQNQLKEITDTIYHYKIDSVFHQYYKSFRNPKTAQFLSILPGLGQAYSGDARNAVNAFLLNGILIGLTVWQAQIYWVPAVVLGTQLVSRYYLGNMKNARKSAIFKNNQRKNNLLNFVLKSNMLHVQS